jgi:hypothetical protein
LRGQGREEPKHSPDPASLRLTGAMPPPRPVSAANVRCWSCKAPLALTEETRGHKVACPQCGTRQRLPQ